MSKYERQKTWAVKSFHKISGSLKYIASQVSLKLKMKKFIFKTYCFIKGGTN